MQSHQLLRVVYNTGVIGAVIANGGVAADVVFEAGEVAVEEIQFVGFVIDFQLVDFGYHIVDGVFIIRTLEVVQGAGVILARIGHAGEVEAGGDVAPTAFETGTVLENEGFSPICLACAHGTGHDIGEGETRNLAIFKQQVEGQGGFVQIERGSEPASARFIDFFDAEVDGKQVKRAQLLFWEAIGTGREQLPKAAKMPFSHFKRIIEEVVAMEVQADGGRIGHALRLSQHGFEQSDAVIGFVHGLVRNGQAGQAEFSGHKGRIHQVGSSLNVERAHAFLRRIKLILFPFDQVEVVVIIGVPPGLSFATLTGFAEGDLKMPTQVALAVSGSEAYFTAVFVAKLLFIHQVFFQQGE